MTRVLLLRGHYANLWELKAWSLLPERFDVACVVTHKNAYPTEEIPLERVRVRSLRDFLPRGAAGDLVATVAGDRYIGIDDELAAAGIVHASELSFWFAAEAAKRKPDFGYKLVLTVWETIPFLDTYRTKHAREYRRLTLPAADLFLAATERARQALLIEGVEPERIQVCYPGIDTERFRLVARESPPDDHVIVSPGRLEWEKGHQDVMRAVAAIHRELVPAPAKPRLLIVGSGAEEKRLRAYALELGINEFVEYRAVPYHEMPRTYALASVMVLGSLPGAGCSLYVGDPPRCFWEEQFGLVFAEAMAAGLPIITTTSGAIPEVVGDSGDYFAPGDWMDLAHKLAAGPLSRPPATRVEHPENRVRLYSTDAMAARLADAYDGLLAS